MATNAIVVRRTVMGPNELSWMEAALAVLAKAGLSPKERYHAFLAIIGLVRGHATFEQIKNHSESPRKWARELADLLRSGGNTYRLCERSLQRALSQAILTMRLNMVLTAFWTESAQGRADPGRRPVDSAKSLNTVSDSLAHLKAASTLAWIVGLDAVPVIVTGMPWLALPGAGLAAA